MSARRLWTSEEDAYLREHYFERGARHCCEALGRPFRALVKRAARVGAQRRRPWTEQEDGHLRIMWGPHTIPQIARRLGRSEQAVYWRARKLRLGLGCPQGYEYLSESARRTGFAVNQLRRILRFAHRACPTRAIIRPGYVPQTRHVTHIVDPLDVDEAIGVWLSTETITEGARRHGCCPSVLHRLATQAFTRGDARIHPPSKRGYQWRVSSVVIDELLGAHLRRDSVRSAAERHNVNPKTLRAWLNAAGLTTGHGVTFEPETVNAIVQSFAARTSELETIGAAARRHGRSWPFVSDIIQHADSRGELTVSRLPGRPWRLPPETFDSLIARHLAGESGRRTVTQTRAKAPNQRNEEAA